MSSLDKVIQVGLLFLCLLYYLKYDIKNKNPYSTIDEIRISSDTCTLKLHNGSLIQYDQVKILIHNELFQLLRLSGAKTRKLVLFNDQLPFEQLRLLHVKVGIM